MRAHVITAVVVAVVVTALSFAIAQAGTSTDSASNRSVVRELRKLNRNVSALDRHTRSSLGAPKPNEFSSGTAIELLDDICESVSQNSFRC